MKSSGLMKGEVGLATGIGTAMALLIQPILGKWSDKVDARRPFIFICSLVAFFAFTSFPYATSLATFCLLFALGTNGTTYLQASTAAIAGRMVSGPGGGKVYASLRVWGSVGYIIVSLTTGILLRYFHKGPLGKAELDPVFFIGPSLFLGIAALAWFLPDRRNRDEQAVSRVKVPISGNLKTFLISYFLYNISLYGATSFLSIYMETLGADGLWITGMFAAGVVIEVMVMTQSGAWSDRYGRRPALAISYILLPIRLFLYAPATGPLWLLMVQSLHGINFGIVGAVAVAFANDLAGEGTHGQAQARLFATQGFAAAVGPVLFGFTSEAFGLRTMFVVAGAIALAAAVVLVFGVEDSHSGSRSIADRFPTSLRPFVAWLDHPPRLMRNK